MRSISFSAAWRRSTLFLLLLVLLAGCGYMRIIRNRIPAPHYIERNGARGVLFQYEAPQAKHVSLCGNWNENSWCGTKGTGRFDHDIGVMLDEDHDGIWEIFLELPPGRYEYKYAVDWGMRWESDPSNPVGMDDGFGGQNSILILN